MTVKRSAKRSSVQRGVSLFGLSSSLLFSSAAFATSVSLIYTGLAMPDSLVAKWLVRPLAITGLVSVGSSGATPLTLDPTTGTVNATTTTTTPTPTATAIKPVKIGMNVAAMTYYGQNRVFMNLRAGDTWHLQSSVLGPINPTADQLDSDGNYIKLNPYETVRTGLTPPAAVLQGKASDIICRWKGTGSVRMENRSSSANITSGDHWLRFTWVPGKSTLPTVQIAATDQTDPVRAVDCREVDADPQAMFDPTFLASVRKYNTLRFLDWQNINANKPVTWATRTRPGMAYYFGKDGYPIEYMIELANEAKTNLWIQMPWNADDDYVRQFATMVRDKLDPSLKAYVETSNEVWNFGFPVATQAMNEGLAEGLSTDGNLARYYRYAEKVGQDMDIWSDVFAGQMSRIVRVAASQQWDSMANYILGYKDTASKVDALASAPYFGMKLTGTYDPNSLPSDFVGQILIWKVAEMNTKTIAMKKVADKYGVRYITYEGGQTFKADDVDLLRQVERDPIMGQAYTSYLTNWQQNVGDLMVLYNSVGPISQYGAWGLQEYSGQPFSEAPKAQAVYRFIASINNK